MLKSKIKDDNLAKLLLKKIRLEVCQGQVILQLGDKHEQITEMLERANMLKKVSELSEAELKKKSYSYVIADMDSAELDDFEGFLDKIAPTIIRPGLLIIVGTNLCTLKNKIKFLLNKAPREFSRPNRSVPTSYVRDTMLKKGFFVKNRFWRYDDKFLIMADIPLDA